MAAPLCGRAVLQRPAEVTIGCSPKRVACSSRYDGLVNSRSGDFSYDVALSFAGEQRAYVEKVAAALRRRGIRPFYDDYEQAVLWGKDLYEHLDWVYQKAARYCVLFASEAYARKVWTTHERRSAQARALSSDPKNRPKPGSGREATRRSGAGLALVAGQAAMGSKRTVKPSALAWRTMRRMAAWGSRWVK